MPVRVIVRTVSELCITVGALIVLFVVYVVFRTGVKADGAMSDQIGQLQKQWAKETVRTSAAPTSAGSPGSPGPYAQGRPFAVMYVPRSVSRGTSPCSRTPPWTP